ncbi:MAG: hypothetical protein IKM48_00350 [Clostridia bacterium]|nr:hypothetical protein [Clostridia bacterium]
MKELYLNFLHIPKGGKVPEKVMLARIAISIAFILMCLAAMSVSAYAFFTSTVTSPASVIQSAVYQLEVIPNGFEEQDGVYPLSNDANAVKTFDFTIKPTEQSNAKVGYAKIIIDDGETKLEIFTAPIWTDSEKGPVSRSFAVDVAPKSAVTMTVISQWGSCSAATVAEGGVLIDLPDVTPIIEEEETNDPQEPAVTPDTETKQEGEGQTTPADDTEDIPSTSEPSVPPSDTEKEKTETEDTSTDDAPTEGAQPTDPQPDPDNGEGVQTEDTPTDPVTE